MPLKVACKLKTISKNYKTKAPSVLSNYELFCPQHTTGIPAYKLSLSRNFSAFFISNKGSSAVDSSTRETEFQTLSEPFKALPILAPVFPALAKDIQILNQPKEFFEALKTKIKKAKKSITIASLYIGQNETELIEVLKEALNSNKALKVNFLLDCLRGTRISSEGCSIDSLIPLIKLFKERVTISLYHTPALNGWTKKIGPNRFNETIGLMHLKVYIFDEDVILSGANLSHDYFTNRQDRYYLFNDSFPLSNYFQNLVRVISELSYSVVPNSELPEKYSLEISTCPDPVYDSDNFKAYATLKIVDFLQDIRFPFGLSSFEAVGSSCDTVVVPVVQMGQLNILQDQKVTLSILSSIDSVGRLKAGIENRYSFALTSGYFNFNNVYQERILNTSAVFKIITASPQANGFFGSKGISSFIPDAYTLIEREFIQKATEFRRNQTIKVEEYSRPGWTYHAKGLWVTRPRELYPFMTSIGSPNFGYRSLERDLEAQAFIITSNPKLRFEMKSELDNITSYAAAVDQNSLSDSTREPRLLAKLATPFIRSML